MDDGEHSPELDKVFAITEIAQSSSVGVAVPSTSASADLSTDTSFKPADIPTFTDTKPFDVAGEKVEQPAVIKPQRGRPRTKRPKDSLEGEAANEPKKQKRKKKSVEGETTEGTVPLADGEEKKKRRRERQTASSIICELKTETGDPGCKQRAICGYRYCIRHILNDPSAPYIQCSHTRRPKNKTEAVSRCTNAIKKDSGETCCSTHLIMAGLKEAKKKPGAVEVDGRSSTPGEETAASQPTTSGLALPSMSLEKDPRMGEPLPAISLPPDSHLLRALTSPAGLPPPPPPAPEHSILRSVLENKVEPRLLTQTYMPAPAAASPAAGNEPVVAPEAVSEDWRRKMPLYDRRDEDVKALIGRMDPGCRVKFAEFLVRRRERKELAENAELLAQPGQRHMKILRPELLRRMDVIWKRLDPVARKRWTASLVSRGGVKVGKGEVPFNFEELQAGNPHLAQQIVKARKMIPPTRISCSMKQDIPTLPKGAPPIRFNDSDTSDDDEVSPWFQKLKIRAKMQVRNMAGPYRDIHSVNEMCNKIERDDFDQHSMFPLGYESSDEDTEDEEGYSAPPTRPIHPVNMTPSMEHHDREMQLYLLRKQLRLERHQLMKTAQVNAPIMVAVRKHPMSTGAALRQQMESNPAPSQLITSTIRRCCQVENKQRCERSCLPSSNHCNVHVLYNVNQKLFQFCTHPQFCRRPVLAIDALLWDGKCKLHRDTRLEKFGPYPLYHDLEEEHLVESPEQQDETEDEADDEHEDEEDEDEEDEDEAEDEGEDEEVEEEEEEMGDGEMEDFEDEEVEEMEDDDDRSTGTP